MKVKQVAITKLVENNWNPNRMDDRQVKQLSDRIKEVGFLQPILARPLGGERWEILDGTHRVRAADMAGLTAVPIVEIESDELPARMHTVAMNRLRGEPDYLLEAKLLDRLLGAGVSKEVLVSLGILSDELDSMLQALAETDNTMIEKALANTIDAWDDEQVAVPATVPRRQLGTIREALDKLADEIQSPITSAGRGQALMRKLTGSED